MRVLINKIAPGRDSFLFKKQTVKILNHLTLHISNKEVRDSFDKFQSQKFDRVLWFAIPAEIVILFRDWLQLKNPVLILQHAILLSIYFIYIVMRARLANTNRLYEWAVFLTFAVNIIISSLINSRVLPGTLFGFDSKASPSTNQFRGAFYTYSAFSVLKVDSFVFAFGPLFLIGEYFFLKNDAGFYQEIFENQEYAERYENFD